MHVRLTYFQFSVENEDEVKRIYQEEIVPVVKRQKGNIDIMLWHPTNDYDDHISYSTWESIEDAAEYEASGKYAELVAKIKGFLIKGSSLKSYNVQEF